jgi:hypothetical protein
MVQGIAYSCLNNHIILSNVKSDLLNVWPECLAFYQLFKWIRQINECNFISISFDYKVIRINDGRNSYIIWFWWSKKWKIFLKYNVRYLIIAEIRGSRVHEGYWQKNSGKPCFLTFKKKIWKLCGKKQLNTNERWIVLSIDRRISNIFFYLVMELWIAFPSNYPSFFFITF